MKYILSKNYNVLNVHHVDTIIALHTQWEKNTQVAFIHVMYIL